MFRTALAVARKFTQPVVISRKTVAGDVSASIGTYVTLNKDGWILTAGHIIQQILELSTAADSYQRVKQAHDAIDANSEIAPKDKNRHKRGAGVINPTDTERWSGWFGRDDLAFVEAAVLPAVDLGIARLTPADPVWFQTVPVLKDPAKDFEPGVSLCKLGFPFHSFAPTWNGVGFEFPPGALPMPFFPLDGILTRLIEMQLPAEAPDLGFPLQMVETSTPGLRGQSGGPTIDIHGTIWAIQCRTAHLSLGFDCEVPGRPNVREHQFLNVGQGVHSATIIGLLKSRNINFQMSDY